MSQRRYNTVHDLAALRLHPDGTRVLTSAVENARPRRAKYTVQDARGNWIAADAGGLGRVAKRRWDSRRSGKDGGAGSGQEEFDMDGAAEESEGEGEKRDDKWTGNRMKDRRAKKRQRFHDDFDFLDAGSLDARAPWPFGHPAEDAAPESPTHSLDTADTQSFASNSAVAPVPSSDLLKAIHHFATTFYTERGQLVDAGRDARREAKRRRLARLRARTAEGSSNLGTKSAYPIKLDGEEGPGSESDRSEPDEDSQEEEISGEDGRGSGGSGSSDTEESSDDPEEMDEQQYAAIRARADARAARDRQRPRDMYKAFDGSALMVIGMLVEAHMVRLLEPQGPPNWVDPEDEIAQREEDQEEVKVQGGRKRRRRPETKVSEKGKARATEDLVEKEEQVDAHVDDSDDSEFNYMS